MRQFLTLLLVQISLGLMGVGAAVADPIDFNREIRPILSDNCFQCHGPDAAERKGDLRLDTEDGAYAVLVAGKPDESLLIERVFHEDAEERMPPSELPKKLSEAQKKTLRDWIKQGASWAKHWAR